LSRFLLSLRFFIFTKKENGTKGGNEKELFLGGRQKKSLFYFKKNKIMLIWEKEQNKIDKKRMKKERKEREIKGRRKKRKRKKWKQKRFIPSPDRITLDIPIWFVLGSYPQNRYSLLFASHEKLKKLKRRESMKKYILTGGTVIASSIGISYIHKKIIQKKNQKDRKELVNHFISRGYKVHSYNNNLDMILFNNKSTIVKYVIIDNGQYKEKEFEKKLDAYFHHFTNHFYFISINDEKLDNSSKPMFEKWVSNSRKERKGKKVTAYFSTKERILRDLSGDPWEKIKIT
jgi:hypothetical protein